MTFITQLSQVLFLTDDSSAMRLDDEHKAHYAIEDITFSKETAEGEIVLYLFGEEQLFFSEQSVEVSESGKLIAYTKDGCAYEIMAWMNCPVTLKDITSKAHLRPTWFGDAPRTAPALEEEKLRVDPPPPAVVCDKTLQAQQCESAWWVLDEVCIKLRTPFSNTRVYRLLDQFMKDELQSVKDLGRINAFLVSPKTRRNAYDLLEHYADVRSQMAYHLSCTHSEFEAWLNKTT